MEVLLGGWRADPRSALLLTSATRALHRLTDEVVTQAGLHFVGLNHKFISYGAKVQVQGPFCGQLSLCCPGATRSRDAVGAHVRSPRRRPLSSWLAETVCRATPGRTSLSRHALRMVRRSRNTAANDWTHLPCEAMCPLLFLSLMMFAGHLSRRAADQLVGVIPVQV